ncbi:MAG: tetratricopeptide repeat protein [Alphaproteobacteria bacterium]|nr:tetratricopeptide repeat protein [Alphaproteobacteria bacterium]
MRSWQRRLSRTLGIGALVATLGTAALAQGVNPSADEALKRRYDEAFRAVFADPGNLDKSFAFAEVAIQVGNFEAAISALERMLIINPNLPRVRLELGVLYFRLGSYDLARTYLQAAVEGPNVPPEVRTRVAAFLDEIAKRQSRHQISGSVFAGMRWQSNANAAPSSTTVLANGVVATLNNRFTATDDANGFVSGSIRHLFDMQTARGEAWGSNGTAYFSEQFDLDNLDLVFLRVDTGPRMKFGPGWFENATFRPYLIANMARLDGVRYLEAFGIGGDYTHQFTPRRLVDLTIEAIEREFENGAAESRTIAEQSGSSVDVRLSTRVAASEMLMLNAAVGLIGESADRAAFRASDGRFIQVGGTLTYDMPAWVKEAWLMSEQWSSSLTIHRQLTDYEFPDPSVSTTVAREDREWRVAFTQAIPVTQEWPVVATLQRSSIASNIVNFDRNNTSVTLGVSYRF